MDLQTAMKDIRIFVASSREMVAERNALAYFAIAHEDEFAEQGLRVRLSKWEYVDPCVTTVLTEERYLEEMHRCDAAFILFREKLGTYTQKECADAVQAEKDGTTRLKAHRILFKEGADIAPSAELLAWRATLPDGAYGTFGDRIGLEREFLKLIERVSAEELVELPKRSELRTVVALFAADDELAGERDAVADLALDLNERMGHYGARVKMRFYVPERHRELLESSEMAMAVYYTRIGAFGWEQMEDAYGRVTQGENPQRLYVVFRSAEGKELDADFRAFRDSFEAKRGYFVGWFDHVDSLKNDVLLSLVSLLGDRAALDDVRLEGAWVTFGGLKVADMSRLPMVAKNRGLNALKVREAELDARWVECRVACERNPSDEGLAARLRRIAAERLKVKDQIENELKVSLDLAKRMSSFVVGKTEKKLQEVRAKLENGEIEEARRILDELSALRAEEFSQVMRNAEVRAEEMAQDVRKLQAGVEVDMFRADVVLADTGRPFRDRLGEAAQIHQTWIERLEVFGRTCSGEREEDVDTLLVEMLHGLSYLYAVNGREKEALPWIKKALEIRRLLAKANPQKHEGDLAGTLNNLALLYYDMQRFDEAEVEYGEALEVYRRLAGRCSEKHEEYVATTLNNLANLHAATNRLEEAEKEYGEALEAYRRLARTNLEKYNGYVAGALNNLATLHASLNRFDVAEREYDESLEIRRQLARVNPEMSGEYVATTLINLANLHTGQNRFDAAEREYGEALEVYRRLADANLEKYGEKVAGTLNNLANLHTDLDRFDMAEREYDEALEIRRRLAKINPEMYEDDVATTLNNLAVLHADMCRYGEAAEEYSEVLAIRRRLARTRPERGEGNLAMTLNNLATMHKNLKRFVEAEQEYGEALEIYCRLAETSPVKYDGDLAGTLNNFANMNRDLKRFSVAEEKYDKALEIYRRLAGANPEKYEEHEAQTQHNLALLCVELTRLDEAAREFEEVLEIRRRLAKANPEKYEGDVAKTLLGFAAVHARLGLAEKAEAEANEALAICRRLAQGDEAAYGGEIAACEKLLAILKGRNRRRGCLAGAARIVECLLRVLIALLFLPWRGIRFVVRCFKAAK